VTCDAASVFVDLPVPDPAPLAGADPAIVHLGGEVLPARSTTVGACSPGYAPGPENIYRLTADGATDLVLESHPLQPGLMAGLYTRNGVCDVPGADECTYPLGGAQILEVLQPAMGTIYGYVDAVAFQRTLEVPRPWSYDLEAYRRVILDPGADCEPGRRTTRCPAGQMCFVDGTGSSCQDIVDGAQQVCDSAQTAVFVGDTAEVRGVTRSTDQGFFEYTPDNSGCYSPDFNLPAPEGLVRFHLDSAAHVVVTTDFPDTALDLFVSLRPDSGDCQAADLACIDDQQADENGLFNQHPNVIQNLPAGDYLIVLDSFGTAGFAYSHYGTYHVRIVTSAPQTCDDLDGDLLSTCTQFNTEPDCDDDDASVFPGAGELCDGKDNDCNGLIDDGC
jgi:hypothetical protein